VALFDSDDEGMPDKLNLQWALKDLQPDVVFRLAEFGCLHDRGARTYVCTCSAMVRREKASDAQHCGFIFLLGARAGVACRSCHPGDRGRPPARAPKEKERAGGDGNRRRIRSGG
jgi:hypothetical protein